MDSKKISALICAIDMGSLTAAASELGYTQSGLTHMMNSLEAELGLNLLVRSKGGVRLSPAGQELLPEMRALLAAAEELEHSADRLRQRNVFTLRLGAYSSIARHWIPEMLSYLKQECPNTQVQLTMNSIESLYTALKNDELDCAMLSYQENLCQGLCWIPLWQDELLAILPSAMGTYSDSFPVEDFEGSDFLMPSMGFDLDINPIFSSLDGIKINPSIHSTNMDDASIVSMVEHGLGVSVMSRLVMQDMKYTVRVLPLSPAAFRSLGIAVSDRLLNDRNIRKLVCCAKELVARKYGVSAVVDAEHGKGAADGQ